MFISSYVSVSKNSISANKNPAKKPYSISNSVFKSLKSKKSS